MRSSPDECPRCGAPLPGAIPGVDIRTCGYCHTTVEAHELLQPQLTRPAVLQRRGFSDPRSRLQFLVAAGVVIAGLVLARMNTSRAPRPAPLPPPPVHDGTSTPVVASAPPPRERLRALPGLVLVEQEDKADAFLVLASPLEGSERERWLTARDPASGRELWRHPVDVSDAADRILRIPFDSMLVVALPNELWGLDAGTGQSSWQRARTTTAVHACGTERAFGLVGADGHFATYSITTGSPVSLKRAACADVYTSNADAPNFAFVDAAKAARWLPSGDRFVVQRGLLPRHGSAQVVLGAEANGTASAGVLNGGRWLWQANVANEDPELAHLTAPPLAAVREECVVVAYSAQSRVVLTALGLESGDRRWTTPLAAAAEAHVESGKGELAVSRGGHVAYRAASGEFWVLNLDTGAIEWTLHERG